MKLFADQVIIEMEKALGTKGFKSFIMGEYTLSDYYSFRNILEEAIKTAYKLKDSNLSKTQK